MSLLDLTIRKVLGHHGRNRRIWISSRNIFKTGMQVGSRINVIYGKSKIEFVSDANGSKVVSGRDEQSPIIDLKNAKVEEYLGNPEKIEIRFFENRIEVTVAKTEQKRHERASKHGKRMFELFCGGGTLHHLFKKSGFESAGGLEMEDNYLAVFDQNNPNHDKVTICASIEDVDVSDYPQGVDLVVAGIPCTTFSQGNLQMIEELRKLKNGEETNPNVVAKRYEAEALVYHVLRAIEAMNPKQVVVEEVPQFAETGASMLLRTVLGQRGYHLSETVAEALHTKRKRWCLVADMSGPVSLDNLPQNDGKTIGDFLDVDVASREWKSIGDSKRFSKASSTVGLRSHTPDEVKTNTFTTHGTRSTEPCLKHPEQELYDEFSNSEIARIHGLDGYVLPEGKGLARQILGQGVADMFTGIAKRVYKSGQKVLNPESQEIESGVQIAEESIHGDEVYVAPYRYCLGCGSALRFIFDMNGCAEYDRDLFTQLERFIESGGCDDEEKLYQSILSGFSDWLFTDESTLLDYDLCLGKAKEANISPEAYMIVDLLKISFREANKIIAYGMEAGLLTTGQYKRPVWSV